VVTVGFKLLNARSTYKVVSRAPSMPFTARVEHVIRCLFIDVEADVLGGAVGKLCSVHAYTLHHFVNYVKYFSVVCLDRYLLLGERYSRIDE
jgi:hypothetical protein